MKNNAVLQRKIEYLPCLAAAAFVALATFLAYGPVGSAGAAKLVGKDGQVYACYKASGKAKGSVRLVAKKQRCKRGERRVNWAVTGPSGVAGQTGATGASGQTGTTGSAGTSGSQVLEAQVTSLTEQVETLEKTLQGVTNETLTQGLATVSGITNTELTGALATVSGVTNAELTGALSKLEGVSGAELQETVASLADINALCTQATALTSQVNSLTGALDDTVLSGIIPLGLELLVPGLPAELSSFVCPS